LVAKPLESYIETPEWDLAKNPTGEFNIHLQRGWRQLALYCRLGRVIWLWSTGWAIS